MLNNIIILEINVFDVLGNTNRTFSNGPTQYKSEAHSKPMTLVPGAG